MSVYKIKLNKARCIGCHACVVHCKVKNRVPVGISLNRFTAEGPLRDKKGRPVMEFKYQPCLHCKKPECLSVCPTGAIVMREPDGLVLLREDLCDGCKACIEACPWHVPVFDELTGKARKCDYCRDRIDAGLDPACVVGCTAKALSFVRGAARPEGKTSGKTRGK